VLVNFGDGGQVGRGGGPDFERGHDAKIRILFGEGKFGLFTPSDSFFPSPLVGEGGSNERSEFETGEGFRSIDRKRPLIRHGLRPRHLLPQGEKEEKSPGREAGA
jgi:hypothetical protein